MRPSWTAAIVEENLWEVTSDNPYPCGPSPFPSHSICFPRLDMAPVLALFHGDGVFWCRVDRVTSFPRPPPPSWLPPRKWNIPPRSDFDLCDFLSSEPTFPFPQTIPFLCVAFEMLLNPDDLLGEYLDPFLFAFFVFLFDYPISPSMGRPPCGRPMGGSFFLFCPEVFFRGPPNTQPLSPPTRPGRPPASKDFLKFFSTIRLDSRSPCS